LEGVDEDVDAFPTRFTSRSVESSFEPSVSISRNKFENKKDQAWYIFGWVIKVNNG
jgi:hypothetical protein